MPGISPGLRRPSDGRLRGGFGAFGVPPRSSFGARLRNRLPQYGHSVMYGDTSRPQLRQTTKRSGPLAMGVRFYAPRNVAEGAWPRAVTARPRRSTPEPSAWQAKPLSLGRSRRDDLAEQLPPVMVGLVDDPLARGAGAPLEQVDDPLELVGAA